MRFTMDFLKDGYFDEYDNVSFEGIDLNNKWNGWSCPAFTKEVADEIAFTLNKCSDEFGRIEFFDSDDGGYYVSFEDGVEYERFEAMVIDGTLYYPIGAYSWIWETV